MTIIAPSPTTAGDALSATLTALADLVRIPALAPAYRWEIGIDLDGQPFASGQMANGSLADTFRTLTAYAECFDDAHWAVDRYQVSKGGALRLTGTYGGAQLTVWSGLSTADLYPAEVLAGVTA